MRKTRRRSKREIERQRGKERERQIEKNLMKKEFLHHIRELGLCLGLMLRVRNRCQKVTPNLEAVVDFGQFHLKPSRRRKNPS